MGYSEVMALPLRAFWLMSRNIDRIMAQGDMRSMSVAVVAQSSAEGVQQLRQALAVETGTIVKLQKDDSDSPLNAQRDEQGFAELRAMAGQRIGR